MTMPERIWRVNGDTGEDAQFIHSTPTREHAEELRELAEILEKFSFSFDPRDQSNAAYKLLIGIREEEENK